MAIMVNMYKKSGEDIVRSEQRKQLTRTAFEAILEEIGNNDETEFNEYNARDEWMEVTATLRTGWHGWWGYEVHMHTVTGDDLYFTL